MNEAPRWLAVLVVPTVVVALGGALGCGTSDPGSRVGRTTSALSTPLDQRLAPALQDGWLSASGGAGPFASAAEAPGESRADFRFDANVRIEPGVTGDLQFRISNEGRYGLAFEENASPGSPSRVRLYKLTRLGTLITDPALLTNPNLDPLAYVELTRAELDLDPFAEHSFGVEAHGTTISVHVDGVLRFSFDDTSSRPLLSGRLGVQTFSATRGARARFTALMVSSDDAAASNYALLYSTNGYEQNGTKRALVRALTRNSTYPDAAGVVVSEANSGFELTNRSTGIVTSGPIAHGAKFGMDLWEADFSGVTAAGEYALRVHLRDANEGPIADLDSDPFTIAESRMSATMLKPMTILNAEARSAADEDFRRNWAPAAGSAPWRVGSDGAFYADNAPATGPSARLLRVENGYGQAETDDSNKAFTLAGDVAVMSGCDAALQFHATASRWYSLTLLAAGNSNCPQNVGSSSVRLAMEGPGAFQTLVSVPWDIQAATKYDVLLSVSPDRAVRVLVNGQCVIGCAPGTTFSVPTGSGGQFGLRAYGGSARFDRVRAWDAGVSFLNWSAAQNERVARTDLPYAGRFATCEEASYFTGDEGAYHAACYPLSSQRHGFHDCNNIAGEADSHGVFLAGLVDTWAKRRSSFGRFEETRLKSAILTADTYLGDLYRYSGATGQFTHEEPSRGAPGTNLGYYQTLDAAYGESAFAVRGADIDSWRARGACERLVNTVKWLTDQEAAPECATPAICQLTGGRKFAGGPGYKPWYGDVQSLFHLRVAQCSRQYGIPESSLPLGSYAAHETRAKAVAREWAHHLAEAVDTEPRHTGRLIPWLEGVDEVGQAFPSELLAMSDDLQRLAVKLADHVTPHAGQASAGFHVLPVDVAPSPADWNDTDQVPTKSTSGAPGLAPERQGSVVAHFASSAYDASVLARLTAHGARRNMEALAAGNLSWIVGLHPGLPSSKVTGGAAATGPWTTGAFVHGLGSARARGYTSWWTVGSDRKVTGPRAWASLGEEVGNDRQEAWYFEPKNNGFMSVVNGHVIVARDVGGRLEGEWDYWNQGKSGWESGETFMAVDGAFLKAFLYYEDVVAGRAPPPLPAVPPPAYDVSKPTFFDTTPEQRFETGWGFGQVDTVKFAWASRMAHNFCQRRGYASGHPTGHQIGTNIGVVCFPSGTLVKDVDTYGSIDVEDWASSTRVAQAYCRTQTYVDWVTGKIWPYVGGVPTGHQVPGGPLNYKRGVACLRGGAAIVINSSWQALYNSSEGFADVNTVAWAKATRAATNMCIGYQYPTGGFLDGQQTYPGTNYATKELVCYRP